MSFEQPPQAGEKLTAAREKLEAARERFREVDPGVALYSSSPIEADKAVDAAYALVGEAEMECQQILLDPNASPDRLLEAYDVYGAALFEEIGISARLRDPEKIRRTMQIYTELMGNFKNDKRVVSDAERANVSDYLKKKGVTIKSTQDSAMRYVVSSVSGSSEELPGFQEEKDRSEEPTREELDRAYVAKRKLGEGYQSASGGLQP